ncbi:hypothetical protein SAMN05216298_2983 [Glycomyces sambucus]|uniref:Peptidase inhibitor family I36 n=1 Tax=Glycomyces sambucus TaxID=380244 RepID=A0A1G9I1U6_9ACTN|nr:hypothetical protein [Glycomyces sambucus]SDL19220.1 hypothetical protein SAMN05216298_2983 [Glycomyces sambucus]
MRDYADRLRRRVSRTVARTVVFVAAAALAVFALPAAAMAEDNFYESCTFSTFSCQTGVTNVLVEGDCMSAGSQGNYTTICVDYSGDYVYVHDGQADGHSAIGFVFSTRGSVNSRICRNNHGYDTWAKCNFNWTEDALHSASAGYVETYYRIQEEVLWGWSGK